MNRTIKALAGRREPDVKGGPGAPGRFSLGYGMAAAVVMALFLSAALLAVSVHAASAGPPEGPAVRYGTYCLGHYGAVQKGANIKDAIVSLRLFFEKRGLSVRILEHDMRFIRADVYKGDERVDSVVLDARTGKMRSTY